jgi:NAD(P)-dependent dehydrogenase (short-subunit alcohol dehydrogenase family)
MPPAREPQIAGEQKRVLVTGATGALGREIVRALSPQFAIVACYGRNHDGAQLLQRETGCEIFPADVSRESDVERLFQTSFWAIVHAAGIARDALLLRQSLESWHQTLRVNADGAFLVARAALRNLPRGGRLILLSSRVGERGAAGQAAYAASKAAMLALCKTAAREGAESGICVNAICPPFVPSALSENLSGEAMQALQSQSVFGCEGSAREVVGAVQWLLGDAAGAISGQVIHCDARI